MSTEQHIAFLKRMRAEIDEQIAQIESVQKAEFDAKQMHIPVGDGWIQWYGGSCPVKANTKVCVKLRNGEYESGCFTASDYWWDHNGGAFDIIAYRAVA